MAKRDYYEVLGVPRTAAADEIKKSYRRLAMKHHPDRNKDDASAETKFKEAKEAYEILKDPQKRSAYDQFGHAGMEGAFGGGGFTWDNFTHAGDFSDIFGGGGLGSNGKLTTSDNRFIGITTRITTHTITWVVTRIITLIVTRIITLIVTR